MFEKKKIGIAVIAVLLAACLFLIYYFHTVLDSGTAFTHFFYIPIILASLWWRKRGLIVALFLAAALITSHFVFRVTIVSAFNDYARVAMFIAVAVIVALLSEQIRKSDITLRQEVTRRTEFTRAMVHELKTPLTSMMITSELLVHQLQGSTLLKPAENIRESILRLNGRVDELLDLARGEIGMLKMDIKPMDLRQLLDSLGEEMSSVASAHGQSLVVDLPPSLPPVCADANRTRQVVLNLLNNACKFTGEGGLVTLRARSEGPSVIVEVQDTGPGIPEQEQHRLFEPYYRLSSNGEQVGGLGLGLSLCKLFVELQGERIWVTSQQGKGSTFCFSLPPENS